MEQHYDQKYFAWQKKTGVLGPILDNWKFTPHIKPEDTVLDFGCGGGFMLQSLNCAHRYGVEINATARATANQNGIIAVEKISDLPADIQFNRIISDHALEHVICPHATLSALKEKLTADGLLIMFLPIDDWRREKKFIASDINKHLYTWTPLLIGNLLEAAGFKVKTITIQTHAWIPWSKHLHRLLPKVIFNSLCTIWSILNKSRQIKVIATK